MAQFLIHAILVDSVLETPVWLQGLGNVEENFMEAIIEAMKVGKPEKG